MPKRGAHLTLIDWITGLPSFHEKEHSCLQVIQPFARFTATPECLLKKNVCIWKKHVSGRTGAKIFKLTDGFTLPWSYLP